MFFDRHIIRSDKEVIPVERSIEQYDKETIQLIQMSMARLANECRECPSRSTYQTILLNAIQIRKFKKLPPYRFAEEEDFANYLRAVKQGNTFAVDLFTECGLNPFDPDSPFHERINCITPARL